MTPAARAAWNHAAVFRHYRRNGSTVVTCLRDLVLLHEQASALIDVTARRMREDGYSWAEIGEVLGISRQAAQQRYGTVTK